MLVGSSLRCLGIRMKSPRSISARPQPLSSPPFPFAGNSLCKFSTNQTFGRLRYQRFEKHKNFNFARNNTNKLQKRTQSTNNIIQFNLADVGEGIRECEVVKWYVSAGQKIHQFDKVAELLSDKATVEITSRYDGIVTKLHYHTGDIALVGKPLIDIQLSSPLAESAGTQKEEEDEGENEAENEENNNNNAKVLPRSAGKVLATPAVRRIARENDVDLNAITPKDKTGRIRKEDLLHYLSNKSQPSAPFLSSLTSPSSPLPIIDDVAKTNIEEITKSINLGEGDREIQIKGIQKQMAKAMTAAASVPHFGYCEEFVVDDLMKLRSQLKFLADLKNIKLSYLPFFIKACSVALKEFPVLNSHLNSDATVLTYKGSHNIGIAMDTPTGLVVPNIKNVQEKSILEIAQEINRLQSLGKEGKLAMQDLKGGTITLSNIGNIGGTYASPVLFLPEVAIGAIGKIQKVPRYDLNDNVVPVNLVQISWSADHRVIDGATMARFVARMKLLIETPTSLIAELK